MTVYYNEYDKHAAEWLRNLIKAGHIAPGDVDERSINDVRPADLAGYTQCHFFAGIGVWSYALRLAGWPDDRPVWTGSCPCQPFSAAGKGKGGADDRHLWPVWFNLIRECQPVCVFGEQVEAAIRHGWLDLVQADMEGVGYAVGAVGLPAAGFGAPHIRQRLWFVADAIGSADKRGIAQPSERTMAGRDDEVHACERAGATERGSSAGSRIAGVRHGAGKPERPGMSIGLANPTPGGLGINGSAPGSTGHAALGGAVGGVDYADGRYSSAEREQRGREQRGREQRLQPVGCGAGLMGDTERAGLEGLTGHGDGDSGQVEAGSVAAAGAVERPGPTNGHWRDADWIFCREGKWRPVESGTFPVAHGVAGRVGRLRGYGNAIVAQVAAEVIGAFMEVNDGQGSPQG